MQRGEREAMAAAESTVCLTAAAMDNLWFHSIVLLSHRISPRQIKDDVSTDGGLEKEEITATADDDVETTKGRLNLVVLTKEGRSHSHSSSSPKKRELKKSSSLKSLVDLELEEVKGFMDLGFIFRRENLNKRIIHLVPGLQRMGSSDEDEDEDDDEEERKGVIRPYLSEAWIARRPAESPLMMSMSLRIPRVSTAADMKKHLRCWAHTVATAIHQES